MLARWSTDVTDQVASLTIYRRVWSACMAKPARQLCGGTTPNASIQASGLRHTRAVYKWHGGWVARPHRRGFGVRRIACLPPPCWKSSRSAIQGRGDGRSPLSPTESHTTVPRSAPLDGRSSSEMRIDLPIKNEHRCHARDGVHHSIAGVAPAGISRRMFRCLWHTSRGSRFVL